MWRILDYGEEYDVNYVQLESLESQMQGFPVFVISCFNFFKRRVIISFYYLIFIYLHALLCFGLSPEPVDYVNSL